MQVGYLRNAGIVLWILEFISLWAGEIVVFGLFNWARRTKATRLLAAWIILILLGHSFYRGAQRFAAFFLPPLVIYLAEVTSRYWQKSGYRLVKIGALWGTVALFGSTSLFNSAYFATEGRAAADVAEHINNNQIRVIYSPWDSVLTHSGYLVNDDLIITDGTRPEYVTATLAPNEHRKSVVFESEVELLGIVFKRYVLLKP